MGIKSVLHHISGGGREGGREGGKGRDRREGWRERGYVCLSNKQRVTDGVK